MPPRKICKNRHQEIEFGGNLATHDHLAAIIHRHIVCWMSTDTAAIVTIYYVLV